MLVKKLIKRNHYIKILGLLSHIHIVLYNDLSSFHIFFLKVSLQGIFENMIFKVTAHRSQWIKREKNWGIMFSTPNEATAPYDRVKIRKKAYFIPP